MGFRFFRRIHIAPGVRLNLLKGGVSTSIGVKGAHVTLGHGQLRETVGIPGGGGSYSTTIPNHKTAAGVPGAAPATPVIEPLPKGVALRGWLWIVLILAILAALAANHASHAAATGGAPITAAPPRVDADQRGTGKNPGVVAIEPWTVVKTEVAEVTARRLDYRSPEWVLVFSTAALALITLGLAIATYRLFRATVGLGRDAKASALDQSTKMQASIVEANRAAKAMEAVASSTRQNAELMSELFRKQMRAYISVDVGTAVYQDSDHRFEAIPVMTNHGLTPARNVCFKILVDLIDGTDPHVKFQDIGELIVNDVGLAPRQSFTFRSIVKDRIPEEDVESIMIGNKKRLFAWGRVAYEDVYGEKRETNFCLSYSFPKYGDERRVNGTYFPRNNNAT